MIASGQGRKRCVMVSSLHRNRIDAQFSTSNCQSRISRSPIFVFHLESKNMAAGGHRVRKCRILLPRNSVTPSRGKGIIATLRAAIAAQVPVGYEDETGFHVGMKMRPEFFHSKSEPCLGRPTNPSPATLDHSHEEQSFWV